MGQAHPPSRYLLRGCRPFLSDQLLLSTHTENQRWRSQAPEARPIERPVSQEAGPWGSSHHSTPAGAGRASSDTALPRTWLLGTVTVFEVSQRQENKENPSCQCDSDLENPEKGKSWLPASKGKRLPAGGHQGSLGFVSSCC